MDYQFHFGDLLAYKDLLIRGTLLTLELSAIATVLGIAVGTAGALARNSKHIALRWPAAIYVETIRNTPFIVQLFFLFFGLSAVGVRLSAEFAALLAMVVNLGAYATEIVRAGLKSIGKGQIEAGLSIGLTRWQIFRHVLILPALQAIYPALSSQAIIVMLGSSVCSQISAQELTYAANFIQSRNFRSFEVYLVATAIYFVLTVALRQGFALVGRRAFRRR
jgi:polar amino acid transport system permease protein